MCRCCACSRARPSRCSTAQAASSTRWSSTWAAATCDVRVGAHHAVEREARPRSAPGRGHARQRADGLAGGESHRTGRGQHPAADGGAQRAQAGGRARRKEAGALAGRSPSRPASSAGATGCPSCTRWPAFGEWLAQGAPPAPPGACCCRWLAGGSRCATRPATREPVSRCSQRSRGRLRARRGSRRAGGGLPAGVPGPARAARRDRAAGGARRAGVRIRRACTMEA